MIILWKNSEFLTFIIGESLVNRVLNLILFFLVFYILNECRLGLTLLQIAVENCQCILAFSLFLPRSCGISAPKHMYILLGIFDDLRGLQDDPTTLIFLSLEEL